MCISSRGACEGGSIRQAVCDGPRLYRWHNESENVGLHPIVRHTLRGAIPQAWHAQKPVASISVELRVGPKVFGQLYRAHGGRGRRRGLEALSRFPWMQSSAQRPIHRKKELISALGRAYPGRTRRHRLSRKWRTPALGLMPSAMARRLLPSTTVRRAHHGQRAQLLLFSCLSA